WWRIAVSTPLRTLATVGRVLNPVIYVQAHLEPYALPARLACPQQLDRHPAHPSRIFYDIFQPAFSRRRLSHRDALPAPCIQFAPLRFSIVGVDTFAGASPR